MTFATMYSLFTICMLPFWGGEGGGGWYEMSVKLRCILGLYPHLEVCVFFWCEKQKRLSGALILTFFAGSLAHAALRSWECISGSGVYHF